MPDKTDNLRDPRLLDAARRLLDLADEIDTDNAIALATLTLADVIAERGQRRRRDQR